MTLDAIRAVASDVDSGAEKGVASDAAMDAILHVTLDAERAAERAVESVVETHAIPVLGAAATTVRAVPNAVVVLVRVAVAEH